MVLNDLRIRPRMVQVSHAQVKRNATITFISVGATPLLILRLILEFADYDFSLNILVGLKNLNFLRFPRTCDSWRRCSSRPTTLFKFNEEANICLLGHAMEPLLLCW